MRCAVIGAGAWGTALADLLARNKHEVRLWAYESDVVASINTKHENARFLQGHALTETIEATGELKRATESAELIVIATPSHVLRTIVNSAARTIPDSAPLVVATKGIEKDTLCLMTEVVEQELAGATVIALSGPSFASEVVRAQPTAVVVASIEEEAASVAQRAFSSPYFRAYTHTDVVGVELGGALKNVMAVATGIAEGLGLGFNARAALITRGLAEMTRLGVALGADESTFAGLAGLGDLVLTCTGSLSRNRAVGVEIGKGRRLEDVLRDRETVAEGVSAAQSARELARREAVEMPIVDAVNTVLFEGQSARNAIGALMTRELRAEVDR
ncbi:MAG TPA: NAD(P)H-dependent glycerol-3-phosphate dehydrogenase [Gemmatimonadaceae bacterium]|jgi:glycerol-3-phosphate dehydrogenase (NAD(P)+)|nr:NAD(P)H-dependent glycerol-3-phosphate dehydrogenase [Gemmatimonadaceae bacterium]